MENTPQHLSTNSGNAAFKLARSKRTTSLQQHIYKHCGRFSDARELFE